MLLQSHEPSAASHSTGTHRRRVSAPLHALERAADAPKLTPGTSSNSGQQISEERVLRCSSCGHGLALWRHECEVDGASRHTFVNPAMQVFKLVCFSQTLGTRSVGEVSDYWSWFAGYHWQIAVCAACAGHVGWRYANLEHHFFGLIEESIVMNS